MNEKKSKVPLPVRVEEAPWLLNTLLSMPGEEVSGGDILDLVDFLKKQGKISPEMAGLLIEAVKIRDRGSKDERNQAVMGVLTRMIQMSRREIDPDEIEAYIAKALSANSITNEQAAELREKLETLN